jgi:hypothetical protein
MNYKKSDSNNKGYRSDYSFNSFEFNPLLFKKYLKDEMIKKSINDNLKQGEVIEHKKSIEHQCDLKEVHIKNYNKLINDLGKLEYHYFDHDWLTNVNKNDSTNMINLQELNFIPGKSERILQNLNPTHKNKSIEHVHTRIFLEPH